MIDTILVPLDGSSLAEQALPYACRVARQTGAELVLARAAPHAAESAISRSDLHAAVLGRRVTLRDAERYLEARGSELQGQGLRVVTEALHTDAVGGLMFTARARGADLIVMTTHGRTGARRAIAGSVAEHLLHRTTLPVLLVRGVEGPHSTEDAHPFRRILVPLDGTPFAEQALDYVAGETSLLGQATVILLRATSTDATAPPEENPRQYLEAVGRRALMSTELDFAVVPGAAGAAILETAGRYSVDLIVMATHGRIGLDRLVHGSTAYHVVHGAAVPVLLLHGSPVIDAAEAVPTPGRSVLAGMSSSSMGGVPAN